MTGDRFKDGYASAERHWKARWHQANDDLQKAISENERLRTNLWALQEQDERAEIWREKANQYHARLAAVEAELQKQRHRTEEFQTIAAGWANRAVAAEDKLAAVEALVSEAEKPIERNEPPHAVTTYDLRAALAATHDLRAALAATHDLRAALAATTDTTKEN